MYKDYIGLYCQIISNFTEQNHKRKSLYNGSFLFRVVYNKFTELEVKYIWNKIADKGYVRSL